MAKYPIETIRHSAAHVMAAAVQKLFGDVKFDIGKSPLYLKGNRNDGIKTAGWLTVSAKNDLGVGVLRLVKNSRNDLFLGRLSFEPKTV